MMRLEHLPADVHGLSRLARNALSGRLRLPGVPVARTLGEIARPEERFVPEERGHLSRWLETRLSPLGAHIHVLESVRALREPGVSCVISSGGPAFLCGPFELIQRMLQTIRLAELLSREWGSPVVPLFWNDGDAGLSRSMQGATVLNRNLDLQRIAPAGLPPGERSCTQVCFDEERQRLPAIRALLRQIFGDYEHIEESVRTLVPQGGESYTTALTRAVLELFGHAGLVVVEADWIREECSRALAALIGADPAPLLAAGLEALSGTGHDSELAIEASLLAWRLEHGRRRPLELGGEGFRYEGEAGSRTPTELAAEIVQEPVAWIAGRPLRPLVQDTVLPVAARIGDWEELEFAAAGAPLRRSVGLPAVPLVPRVTTTLVDEDCRGSLRRLETGLAQVLGARGALTLGGEEPADGVPPVVQELLTITAEARERLLALRPELARLDPALSTNTKRSVDRFRSAISKLAEKASRVGRNRSGKERRHLRRLNNALCPGGEPQEHVFGPLIHLARYGRGWLDELLAECDPFAAEHVVVHLGPR